MVFILTAFAGWNVQAESDSVTATRGSAEYEITINAYGDALITEEWEYFYPKGRDAVFVRKYQLKEQGYTMNGFAIEVDGKMYEIISEPDSSYPSGKAAVFVKDGIQYVEIYFGEVNTTHKIAIHYVADHVVSLRDNAAEFKWKLTPGTLPSGSVDVKAKIHVEGCTDPESVKCVGTGSDTMVIKSKVDKEGGSLFTYSATDVKGSRPARIALAMPVELFTNAALYYVKGEALDSMNYAMIGGSISKEQMEHPDRVFDEREDFFHLIRFFGCIFLSLIPVIFHRGIKKLCHWFGEEVFLPDRIQRHRLKEKVVPEIFDHIPEDLTPVLAERIEAAYPRDIVEKQGSAFRAVAVDLIRRGVIDVRRDDMGMLFFAVTSKDHLTELEKYVVEAYETPASVLEKQYVMASEIQKFMNDNPYWANENRNHFDKEADRLFRKSEYIDVVSHKIGYKNWTILVYIITAVILGIGLFPFNVYVGIIAILIMGMVNSFIVAGFLRQLLPDFIILNELGEQKYAQIKAFGLYLEDQVLTGGEELFRRDEITEEMIYATALGYGEEFWSCLPEVSKKGKISSDYDKIDYETAFEDVEEDEDDFDEEL